MVKIGIDIGGTTIKLGVVEKDSQIIYRDTRPSPRSAAEMAEVIYQMITLANTYYPDVPAAISIAGSLDKDCNLWANQLGFEKAPLGPELFRRLGHRIPIDNDGICAMMAEYREGALVGADPAMMIILGTGVGGGVVINGKPLRGWNGEQAELGHMITHADGKMCSCGQRGCWEAYASATALKEMAGGIAPREIIDRVKAGDCGELWQQYLWEVAQGLLGLVSIFHPSKIAIGGGLSNAGDIVLNGVRNTFRNLPGAAYYHDVEIVGARFLNDAGIYGAAALIP